MSLLEYPTKDMAEAKGIARSMMKNTISNSKFNNMKHLLLIRLEQHLPLNWIILLLLVGNKKAIIKWVIQRKFKMYLNQLHLTMRMIMMMMMVHHQIDYILVAAVKVPVLAKDRDKKMALLNLPKNLLT